MPSDILITPRSGIPQIIFRGSGNTDASIELNVLSSYGSSRGSGTALVFEGEDGLVFDAIVYNETNNGLGFGSDNFNRTGWSTVKENSTSDWVNIVATYENLNYKMYRNGVLIYTLTSFNALNFNFSSNSVIGYRHTGGLNAYLFGNIAQCAIYNRALSASEIAQNFNATRGRFGI